MVHKHYRLPFWLRSVPALAPLLLVSMLTLGGTVYAQSCFPTCDERDGRFLSVAGTGLQTLAGESITLTFGFPITSDSLQIEIFDGETSGMWDQGNNVPLQFTLYADSTNDGTGTYQVGQWLGNVMPDNAWYKIKLAHTSRARSANGNYFYLLKIRSTNPASSSWSNFKVRTTGTVTLRAGQAFAVTAPLYTLNDAKVIFPNYPTLSPTTYDGSWDFYLDVPAATTALTIYDGDMDRGSADCSSADTDDPDTPNDSLPSWTAGTAAVREGVAQGTSFCSSGARVTGAPADNGTSAALVRNPAVIYEVIDPVGNHYANNNPSGNLEWEQFKISTATFNRNQMDYHADSLPAGTYHVRMTGMDMTNLNAWRFFNDAQGLNANEAMGVNTSGAPVPPLRPHSISGSLFYDLNANGVWDSGEEVMAGVTITLTGDLNLDGTVDRTYTATTDSAGRYTFPNLTTGNFTMRVDTGATVELTPMADYDGVSTPNSAVFQLRAGSGDPTLNFTYVQANPHVIAGTIYYDADANGSFDTGEPVMSGVDVSLAVDVNSDGTVDSTLTTTTGSDGTYQFAGLYAGTYSVMVDSTMLAGDASPLGDVDGVESANMATLTINRGDADAPVDFSYTRLNPHVIAGALFFDANGDGVQQNTEAPMVGQTVYLAVDANSDGTIDSTLSTTTDESGAYSFSGLYAGIYSVRVDTAGMVEIAPSGDFDGAGTPNVTAMTLTVGGTDSSANFTYSRTSPHVVAGTLYYDINGNGTKDAGEPAMSGVTVSLLVDANSDGTVDSTLTRTTNSSGTYQFSNLYAGIYTVRVDTTTLAADVVALSDRDGIATPSGATFTVLAGHPDTTANFTYQRTHNHVIAGTIFVDANGNGTRDAGETALAGIPVVLSVDANSDGTIDSTLTTTTNSSGGYQFSSLYAGVYQIRVDTSSMAEMVPLADIDGIASRSGAIMTLSSGTPDASANFTYSRTSPHVVAGVLYYDLNGNGVQDAGEAALSNVQVTLSVDANSDGTFESTRSTTTGSNGAYQFSNLYSGIYRVSVDAASLPGEVTAISDRDGSGSSNTATFTVYAGGADTSASFTYQRSHTHVIAGTLFYDANNNGTRETSEPALSGVRVWLAIDANSDGVVDSTISTTTSSTGAYQFSGLYSGRYQVRVDSTTLVEVSPLGDADGVSTPNVASLTIAAGGSNPTANFTYVRSSNHVISGVLYYDANSNGTRDANEPFMSGVTVTLAIDANSDGTIDSTRSTTTSSTGAYQFSNLYSGIYDVSVTTTGFAGDVVPVADADGLSTANRASFTISPGGSNPTANFTYRRTNTRTITGTLFYDLNSNGTKDANESGIAGVTVRLAVDANSDGTTDSTLTVTTSSSGVYTFSNLYAGLYRVTVDSTSLGEVTPIADADGISTRNTAAFTLSVGGSNPTANFTYVRTHTHVVAGTIYYDADQDGVQDSGEPGIPTVTVRLAIDANGDGVTDSTLVAVTNLYGAYQFSNLYTCTAVIRVDTATLADDIMATTDPDGTSTENVATCVLQPWHTDAAANFGYMRRNPPGTGTRGYWVNHPDNWPVSSLYLGGVLYSKAAAITVLQKATKGDMTYAMAAQLIATKLNLYNGNNSTCIADTVTAADAWMANHAVGSGVTAGSSAWTAGNPLHNALDDYNNGRLCASHIN